MCVAYCSLGLHIMFDADINSTWYVCDVPEQEKHAIVASYNLYKQAGYNSVTLVDSMTGKLLSIFDFTQVKCAPITEKQAQKAIAGEMKFIFDDEE